jgi:hypothetical protein
MLSRTQQLGLIVLLGIVVVFVLLRLLARAG